MYENHKCYSFSGWKGGTGLGFLRRWWDWMAAVEWPGKKRSFIFSASNKILCAIPARLRPGLSSSPWRMNQNKNKTQNTPQCFSSGWFSKQAHEKVRRRGEIKEEKGERSRGVFAWFHDRMSCSPGLSWTLYRAKNGLEPEILLPVLPSLWVTCVQPHETQTQEVHDARKALCQLSHTPAWSPLAALEATVFSNS